MWVVYSAECALQLTSQVHIKQRMYLAIIDDPSMRISSETEREMS